MVTTATSLITTPSPSAFGQTVNLAATVTSGFGTPTGSVHFLDGSTELGSAELVNGQASINVSTLSIGSHPLTAVYAGDGISTGSVRHRLLHKLSAAQQPPQASRSRRIRHSSGLR